VSVGKHSERGNVIERVGKLHVFRNTNWCGWWLCDRKGERVGKHCGKGVMERGRVNIVGKGQKGETSLKGWGNIVHFRIRIGVGGGRATGKGRGWGNIVERVSWRGGG